MQNLPEISIEQAIKAMENIRDYMTTRPTEQAAAQMAIDALREKQNNPTNQPLTKEEMRKVNDQHIYIQTILNGKPTGTVVCQFWNNKNPLFKLHNYNITWRAFRTMPSLTENF